MGYDDGDDAGDEQAEKRLRNQDDGHESKRNFDAANVCDKKAWMERLELVEQGLSKLRAQPWLTIIKCSVECLIVA